MSYYITYKPQLTATKYYKQLNIKYNGLITCWVSYTPLYSFKNKPEHEILLLTRATAITCELCLVFRTQIFHNIRAQLRFL